MPQIVDPNVMQAGERKNLTISAFKVAGLQWRADPAGKDVVPLPPSRASQEAFLLLEGTMLK